MRDYLFRHVPRLELEALFRAVMRATVGVYGVVRAQWPDSVLEGVPSVRRMNVKEALIGLSRQLTGTKQIHHARSSSDVELHYGGGKVVLKTLTRSKWRSSIPASARRAELASRQPFLSGLEAEFEQTPTNERLLAVVVYGGEHRSDTISFACVLFPDADGRAHRVHGVDLFDEFPHVVEEVRGDFARPQAEPSRIAAGLPADEEPLADFGDIILLDDADDEEESNE